MHKNLLEKLITPQNEVIIELITSHYSKVNDGKKM